MRDLRKVDDIDRGFVEQARELGLIRRDRRRGVVLLTVKGARMAYLLGEMVKRPMPRWIK